MRHPAIGRAVTTTLSQALATALALVLLPGSASSTALPILLDGYYDEWVEAPVHVDPAGDDGSSGIDFRNLWVAEDDDWLFIRFDTTVEVPLDEATDMALYIDTDTNSGTGVSVGGLGAELRWRFGNRSGTFYTIHPSIWSGATSTSAWRRRPRRLSSRSRSTET